MGEYQARCARAPDTPPECRPLGAALVLVCERVAVDEAPGAGQPDPHLLAVECFVVGRRRLAPGGGRLTLDRQTGLLAPPPPPHQRGKSNALTLPRSTQMAVIECRPAVRCRALLL
eukprot:CAMPEP_0174378430 /NCGR_PEP_ID=MMETSP0811_2-20130205/122048_1 /TAXON_ID=73025 ORGANISM="Eutreptiella gymnastica-like, Strain CCMP1594" /NCGR_SAMPLE_ID=MMETSP0811_2 /ASSEMBLY_ACC=CAM_ASM_000667 /LENGTH=115 /DNA_ID=CAMNT_0015530649 /DNA_START=597 /DNA_END=944 /DNA_ORIENTATION=-